MALTLLLRHAALKPRHPSLISLQYTEAKKRKEFALLLKSKASPLNIYAVRPLKGLCWTPFLRQTHPPAQIIKITIIKLVSLNHWGGLSSTKTQADYQLHCNTPLCYQLQCLSSSPTPSCFFVSPVNQTSPNRWPLHLPGVWRTRGPPFVVCQSVRRASLCRRASGGRAETTLIMSAGNLQGWNKTLLF